MTDNVHELKLASTSQTRTIRACHTCKHERREGDDRYDERWCDASGESLDDTRTNDDMCGANLEWWEPKPPTPVPRPPTDTSALARFKKWLIG